jgi:hypothetical protein
VRMPVTYIADRDTGDHIDVPFSIRSVQVHTFGTRDGQLIGMRCCLCQFMKENVFPEIHGAKLGKGKRFKKEAPQFPDGAVHQTPKIFTA